ncbi:MAG: acyl-CoA synthetase [Gammaproteobacteria bacterium]|nr:acyl-CoA synthetase [Gammaproteobacteria bacterium]MCP5458826.1 acyl-CoA synthetase [Gammaproteobacteria bacterium]
MSTSSSNPYDIGLDKNAANFSPLSPLTFLERSAFVYPNHIATVHGPVKRTWAETYARCRQLASALNKRGIGLGDTVAVMLPNLSEMFETHFGVPMSGAVLNTLNVRLDAEMIAFMLGHGEAKVVITDREFSDTIERALKMLPVEGRPLIIDVDDAQFEGGKLLGEIDYESFLAEGDPNYAWQMPADEWQAISLNYTSGTTGNPKGVVYHHRGAYLNAVCNVMSWGMGLHPVYLWTLPMFHCNGWCFPWSIAAAAGTSVSLRHVRNDAIFDSIRDNQVTHFCGAPIVLNTLVNSPPEMKAGISHQVKVMTAGAAPPASVIEGMERMGFEVTHVYGLTETYGPSVLCAWHDEWNDLPIEKKATLKSRQGVRYPMLDGLMVADPKTLEPAPMDGQTIGEIFMRGNLVMKGYLKNPHATEKEFGGGWFHSGDLAVWHPDGYIAIKDRSKDIVISGGENISTIEVEDVLYRHPAVMESAVVARPDDKWGETPCAFITLKPGMEKTTEQEIIDFCRSQLARFKVPKTVVFGELPKTSTGKIQKFVLRDKAKQI